MYDPTVGRFITLDPIGFEGRDANPSRYVGNGATYAIDPDGLWPRDPEGDWSPGEFFGWRDSGLKDATRGGCIGLAAWRAGAANRDGRFWFSDILALPGVLAYGNFDDALIALRALGLKGGLIVAIQQNSPFSNEHHDVLNAKMIKGMPIKDIKGLGGVLGGEGFNYASYLGTRSQPYWEWANTTWAAAGAQIRHRKALMHFSYELFIVIPGDAIRSRSPIP
jgi:hypothetical protein